MSVAFLRASDSPDPGELRVEASGPSSVAWGTAAGDGEKLNPKTDPNEDSAAVLWSPQSVAAVVADAHWGAAASEVAVEQFVRALRDEARPAHRLGRAVDGIATAMATDPRRIGMSETTALAFVVEGSRVTWANVGDSLLLAAFPNGALTVLNTRDPHFIGAQVLDDVAERPVSFVEASVGSQTLPAGTALLLATDGIEPDASGLDAKELTALMRGDAPVAERLRRILERAGCAAGGGGRDNITAVLVEVGSADRPGRGAVPR